MLLAESFGPQRAVNRMIICFIANPALAVFQEAMPMKLYIAGLGNKSLVSVEKRIGSSRTYMGAIFIRDV
jgi:hypothetical protein